MKNIAVFWGGESVEHDVSILTGVSVAHSIDKTRYQVIPVYVDKSGNFYTGESLMDLDNYKKLNLKCLKKVTLLPNDNKLYQLKKRKKVGKLLKKDGFYVILERASGSSSGEILSCAQKENKSMTASERFQRYLSGQPVDRCPAIEWAPRSASMSSWRPSTAR